MDAYLTGIYQSDARRMFRAWANADLRPAPLESDEDFIYEINRQRRERIWAAYKRDLRKMRGAA